MKLARRTWKRDGTFNDMTPVAACANLAEFASDPEVRAKDREQQYQRLHAGIVMETPLAVFSFGVADPLAAFAARRFKLADRRRIFASLVDGQDHASLAVARDAACSEWSIAPDVLEAIVAEGLAHGWPLPELEDD